jgi:thiosulfate dehydrogenase [quinone] large subunit
MTMPTLKYANYLAITSASLVLIYIFIIMGGYLGCLPCGWKATISPHILTSEFLPLAVVSIIVVIAGFLTILFKKTKHLKILNSVIVYWWLFFRVYLGYIWLLAGLAKANLFFLTQGFKESLIYFIVGNSFPWYKSFLEGIVLPHSVLFAYITVIGEIVIGILLIFGLLTRVAAVFAVFASINFILAASWIGLTVAAENLFLLGFEVLLIHVSAGRILGVDQILHKKYSKLSFL